MVSLSEVFSGYHIIGLMAVSATVFKKHDFNKVVRIYDSTYPEKSIKNLFTAIKKKGGVPFIGHIVSYNLDVDILSKL